MTDVPNLPLFTRTIKRDWTPIQFPNGFTVYVRLIEIPRGGNRGEMQMLYPGDPPSVPKSHERKNLKPIPHGPDDCG